MQFNAMEVKIGVNSVENGFGISLSECCFSRRVSLVCWTKINLLLLNVNNWEAPCCLFCNNKDCCCLSVGVYSSLLQNREARSKLFLKEGEISISADTRQFCSA